MRRTRHARSGLSAVEILILLMILSILFFVALPILLRSRLLNHEGVAIQTLRLIYDQELKYQQAMGKVGTLADLALVKRIDPALTTGSVAGYRYRMEVQPPETKAPHEGASENPASWWCQAAPEIYGTTGERCFFIDQSGAIHAKNLGDRDFRPAEEALAWPLIKEE